MNVRHPSLSHGVALAVLALAAWVGLTVQSASAATIYSRSGNCNPPPCQNADYVYAGSGNESNFVVVTQSGGTYRFSEFAPGTVINFPDGRCTQLSATEVTCPVVPDADGVVWDAAAELHGGVDTMDMRTTRRSRIEGGADSDVLRGSSANDTILGDSDYGNNIGPDGADFIDGRGGADFMRGDGATDTVSYASRSTAVTVSLNDVANDGGFGEGDDVRSDVEIVRATEAGDTLTGNDSANQLVGFGGVDEISGLGGPDTLQGGDTHDNIDGGAGNDAIFGEGGPDALAGGANDDAIDGGEGDDGLNGGAGADDMTGGDAGGAGTDSVDYRTYTQQLTVNVGDGQPNDGAAGEGDNVRPDIEQVLGGSGNDNLAMGLPPTSRPPGQLYGGEGNDTLTGGANNDLLEGQGGNDTLDGSYSADVMNGGTGVDTVNYSTHSYWDPYDGEVGVWSTPNGAADDGNAFFDLDDNQRADNVGSDVENVIGSNGADHLVGTTDPNRLQGRGSNDTLIGDAANDVIQGGDGDDTLRGDAGNDNLDGGLGADDMDGGADIDTATYAGRKSNLSVRLDNNANDGDVATNERDNVRPTIENVRGGIRDDILVGSPVANELIGDAGADSLNGRGGADTLNGQAGVDTITYSDRATPVAVTLDQARNDGSDPNGDAVSTAAEEGDLDLNIENADGGAGDDTLRALRPDAVVNLLRGLGGNDTLIARDGTATVDNLQCGTGGADEFRMDPSDVQTGCEVALP